MILTEQEVIKLWDSHTVPVFGKSGINPVVFAQLVESAVLARLKTQEPMCWTNDTELSYSQFKRPDGELTSGSFWAEYHEDCDIPLYTNPLPPADVVRDAERYQFIKSGNVDVEYDGESVIITTHDRQWIIPPFADFDAAIDAAMKGGAA